MDYNFEELQSLKNCFRNVIFNYDTYFGSYLKGCIDAFNEKVVLLREKNVSEFEIEKFYKWELKKQSEYLARESRRASSAVVGGGNFPVRRMTKLNDAQHKLQGEWYKKRAEYFESLIRKANPMPKKVCKKFEGMVTEFREYDAFKIECAWQDNRLRLHFKEQPEKETRTLLKKNRFKWSPKLSVWSNFINTNSISFANKIGQFGNALEPEETNI